MRIGMGIEVQRERIFVNFSTLLTLKSGADRLTVECIEPAPSVVWQIAQQRHLEFDHCYFGRRINFSGAGRQLFLIVSLYF